MRRIVGALSASAIFRPGFSGNLFYDFRMLEILIQELASSPGALDGAHVLEAALAAMAATSKELSTGVLQRMPPRPSSAALVAHQIVVAATSATVLNPACTQAAAATTAWASSADI
jgi:hypothetical protein